MKLSARRRRVGFTILLREAPRFYQNRSLGVSAALDLRRCRGRQPLLRPALFGLGALLLQLPFSLRKDIARRKQLRYGRRLKGPILVDPKEFTKQLAGNGIGLKVEETKGPAAHPPRC